MCLLEIVAVPQRPVPHTDLDKRQLEVVGAARVAVKQALEHDALAAVPCEGGRTYAGR